MPEVTVTTTHRFDPERFYDMADFNWADLYLAKSMMKMPGGSADPRKTVGIAVTTWADANDQARGTEPHLITWQELGAAIAHLASGTYTDHTGLEIQPASYQVASAASIIRGDETEWEWDSETEDLILQMAVFGKVIYN